MMRNEVGDTCFDSHWVGDGDTAQKLLLEQGYEVKLREKRRGVWWVLMVKEVAK